MLKNTRRLTKEQREKRRQAREKAKMKTLKAKIEDVKHLLSDKEVFTSKEMHKSLTKRAVALLKSMGLEPAVLKLTWEENRQDFVAGTDNRNIVINCANSLFSVGSREERYDRISGALAHELSHIMFTNFLEMKHYQKAIENGYLYPSFPKVPSSLSDNLYDLQQFLEGKRGLTEAEDPALANRKALSALSLTLFNVLEDARVEELFAENCYSSKLYTGLTALLKEQYKSCQSIDSIIEGINQERFLSFDGTISLLLHYARFGEIKGFDRKKHPAMDFVRDFFSAKPFADRYLEAPSSLKQLEALSLLIIALFPQIEEYIMKACKNEDDSGKAMEERRNLIKGSTAPGKGSSKGTAGSAAKSGNSEAKGSGEKTGTSAASSGAGENPKETPSAEVPSETPGSDTSSEDFSFESDEVNEDLEKESLSGETEEKASDSFRYSKTNRIINDAKNYGETEYQDASQERSNAKSDLDSIVNSLSRTRLSGSMLSEIEEDLRTLAYDIDFGEVHQGIHTIINRHSVQPWNIEEYETLAPELSRIARKMARKSDYFPEDDGEIEVIKSSGSRFKAAQIVKGNGKYFARDYRLAPKPKIAIAVRIDESGSMGGPRIEAAKVMALLMYLYAKEIGADIAIFGDTAAAGSVYLYNYSSFGSDDPDDKYRIMNISARSCNRDGYALRFILENLLEQNADIKILWGISDGQPSDHGYSGTAAMADLQDVTRICEKEGVIMVQAGIGGDKDILKTIYGDHFLDISDLERLPIEACKLISRYNR